MKCNDWLSAEPECKHLPTAESQCNDWLSAEPECNDWLTPEV